MLCEAVKSYLANAKGVPFFYAVGDENYNQILSELKQNSVIVDRISDFCPKDDKFPDIDDVVDYFRTLDTDYRQNKHVLIGLGEYLALRGSAFAEKILRRLDKTTLGTARVVLLLRCVTQQVNALQIEHHAVLNACNALERLGYPVVYLPVDSQGVVLSDSLSKAITEKTKLVSVMMVNNEIGTIEPIKELATIAHTHNVLFHTDAVQAVGHIPIDVNELGIDMLSSSAHKFNGPKGIGFLYIRKGTQIRPLADGGAQEFHMRAGTENIASIVGMAVALKKNCRTMQETSTKLQAMDHAFIDVLHEANVDFIRNGSVSKSPGIISVSIRNISGEMLLHRLDLKGISISTGSACDSVNTQVSHVIKAIGVPSAYAQGTIRISFGHDNQIEDAVEIAHAIAKILQT